MLSKSVAGLAAQGVIFCSTVNCILIKINLRCKILVCFLITAAVCQGNSMCVWPAAVWWSNCPFAFCRGLKAIELIPN